MSDLATKRDATRLRRINQKNRENLIVNSIVIVLVAVLIVRTLNVLGVV